jgi:hypothetical protein
MVAARLKIIYRKLVRAIALRIARCSSAPSQNQIARHRYSEATLTERLPIFETRSLEAANALIIIPWSDWGVLQTTCSGRE